MAIVVTIVVSCFLTWSLVSSDNHETTEEQVDKSQIILAELKWNGEIHHISLAELEAAISELPVYRQQNYASKAGKTEYLEDYIDEKLKLLHASDFGFDILDEHMKMIDDYTHQLMVEKLTEIEVDDKIQVSEENLITYYEDHKSEYIEDAKARATCITLDDEDLANQILDQIKEGKDIVVMAKSLTEEKKFANGPGFNQNEPGNTNLFTIDASPSWSEFIEAVFEQEIGDITDTVFETDVNDDTYYLIFRKEEHQPERQKELEEVKADVERKVERQMKRTRILQWIEEMSEKANLKTYPGNIPAPVQPEVTDEESESSEEN